MWTHIWEIQVVLGEVCVTAFLKTSTTDPDWHLGFIISIYPLTMRVVGAQKMILQPVSSIIWVYSSWNHICYQLCDPLIPHPSFPSPCLPSPTVTPPPHPISISFAKCNGHGVFLHGVRLHSTSGRWHWPCSKQIIEQTVSLPINNPIHHSIGYLWAP